MLSACHALAFSSIESCHAQQLFGRYPALPDSLIAITQRLFSRYPALPDSLVAHTQQLDWTVVLAYVFAQCLPKCFPSVSKCPSSKVPKCRAVPRARAWVFDIRIFRNLFLNMLYQRPKRAGASRGGTMALWHWRHMETLGRLGGGR
jgi:hypothetical protein